MLPLFLVAGVLTGGCANGTYPLDIFYEMHYQQSFGSQEPPRLSIPGGAVPTTGIQISTGQNPFDASANVLELGQTIFSGNCAFCHGVEGKGDGPVLNTMKEVYGYGTDDQPYTITPDFTDPFVVDQADVGLFGWVTSGVTVMPSFEKLLSVDERWLVVNYIRACLTGRSTNELDCP